MIRGHMILVSFILFMAMPAMARDYWIGNFSVNIGVNSDVACPDYAARIPSSGINLDKNAYLSGVANLCIEVYAQDITEYYRQNIENYLKVFIGVSSDKSPTSLTHQGVLVGRHGNNAIYAFDLRSMNVERNPAYEGRLEQVIQSVSFQDYLGETKELDLNTPIRVHHDINQ